MQEMTRFISHLKAWWGIYAVVVVSIVVGLGSYFMLDEALTDSIRIILAMFFGLYFLGVVGINWCRWN
jgi:hypothetical protein